MVTRKNKLKKIVASGLAGRLQAKIDYHEPNRDSSDEEDKNAYKSLHKRKVAGLSNHNRALIQANLGNYNLNKGEHFDLNNFSNVCARELNKRHN